MLNLGYFDVLSVQELVQTCVRGRGTAPLHWNAAEHPVVPLPWRQRVLQVILAWLHLQVALENLSLQHGCVSSPLSHEHVHSFNPEPGASYCSIKHLQHRFPVFALWEQ